MTERVFNFSAGPAVMPVSVLEEAQRDLVALPGVGMSVMELTHRGPTYEAIHASAQARLRRLLGIPENYKTLLIQGGSRLQFSMVPMNLLGTAGQATSATPSADYVLTGSWGKKAIEEARREGATRVAWDGKAHKYDRLPAASELKVDPNAAFVHITSNETIEGVQFQTEPEVGSVPLVADCSSDFLWRKLPVEKYGLIYACAQKNAGPAGLTIVIIREDLLERSRDSMAGYLNFKNHAAEDSMWNTPPTFAVYMFDLIAKWLEEEIGGLAKMEALNRQKAKLLYDVIDGAGGFYQPHAQQESRSIMNVTFRLPNDELEKKFLKGAEANKLVNLKGHRSVGGIRASIYNAQPMAGAEALASYMKDFCKSNG